MAMANKKDLEEAIRTRYKGLQGLRGSEVMLTPEQIKDAAQAILALSDANMEISLTECARYAIASPLLGEKFKPKLQCKKTICEAFQEYRNQYTEKTANRMAIDSRVGRWINALDADRPIDTVTEEDVINFCKQYENQKTYNNYFTYIRTFLNWCAAKRQQYISENPLEGIKVVAPQWKRPEYLTASQTESLFRLLEKDTEHTDYLAYAIVSFFCGVRAAEIMRGASTDEAMEIDIPNKTITIIQVKRYTQGAHPRSFTIPDNALAWMKSFDFMSAWKKITTKTIDGIIATAASTDVKYPRNAARHSFITHHYAAYESLDRTCKIAGTSAAMVKDNYSGLGKQPDGLAYFNIMPE
jgi:site-specific recombinase XerC